MPDAQERVQLNTVTTEVQDSGEHSNEKVPGAMSLDWAQDAIGSRITKRVAPASIKPKHNIKVQLHELPVKPFAASAINNDE